MLVLYLLFSKDDDYKKDEKKGTIVISTCGGLGNQLFQICFGYSISKRNNSNLLIIPSYDNYHVVDNLRYYDSIFKDFRLRLVKGDYARDYFEPEGKHNKFVPELLNEKCNTSKLFRGYFQSEKYFIDYKDELINIFTDNSVYDSVRESVDKNKMNNSYFIHIRRGDYLNNQMLYINLDVYYMNAIKYILDIDESVHFYIISDDIEYCKRYDVIKYVNKTFYENQDELETMYFMSLCNKGGVCANSTFSWFGSYLNRNPDKVVIFPDKWDNSSNGNDIDIYYTNSIVLPIK
jgi:hypothetical protein